MHALNVPLAPLCPTMETCEEHGLCGRGGVERLGCLGHHHPCTGVAQTHVVASRGLQLEA